jgi:hypothetical protein
MTTVREVLGEQLAANRSSAGERAHFASHRARVTDLCARAVESGAPPSLCVLGAGNANDLDLERLADVYGSIHLVDLDGDALAGAVARESVATRARLTCHAPVDASGLLGRLERWRRLECTAEELAQRPSQAASELRARLGTFDVVLSACLLTQMQRAVVGVLGAEHRLFEAVRFTLTLSHLRSLAALTKPGGRVLFVTDLSATDIAPAIATASENELPALVSTLVARGEVFQVAQPALIRQMAREDPILDAALEFSPSLEMWRWQNGPAQTFLVYALEGRRADDGNRALPPLQGS